MKLRWQAVMMVAVVWGLGTLRATGAGAPKNEEAVEAARAWLALMDAGRYAEGWESAAAYLKQALPKEQFEQSMQAARGSLGNVTLRTLTSTEATNTLPGAPDGEYVVIRYSTTFQHKLTAVETLTPMHEPDGSWRIAGYYIK